MQDRGYNPATAELIYVIRASYAGGRHSDLHGQSGNHLAFRTKFDEFYCALKLLALVSFS